MMSLETLQIIWFLLIGVLFAGYSILDGFDLGVGALTPFISKNEKETRALYNSIGPVWDGNEVWLLTGGGALFAVFPYVYATVFSGFYTALMLLLFALIFRAVSLEFWSLDADSRKIWQISFFLGSFLPSLLFGVALGNVIVGIPLNAAGDYTGTFFTLLRPFPLAIGLLGLAAILMQGALYAAMKTEGDLSGRAVSAAAKLWYFYLFTFILAAAASFIYTPDNISKLLPWVFTVLFAASLSGVKIFLGRGRQGLAFAASSTAFASLWGITGSSMFPNMVKALDPGLSLTIFNSSSTAKTLGLVLVIALIGMPVVIGYTAYIYKIFKGRQRV
jgi:cytochrome d ubiquinol oxidase subunit II